MMTVDSGRVSVKSQVLGLQTYVGCRVNGLDGEVMDDMERGPSGGQSNETKSGADAKWTVPSILLAEAKK